MKKWQFNQHTHTHTQISTECLWGLREPHSLWCINNHLQKETYARMQVSLLWWCCLWQRCCSQARGGGGGGVGGVSPASICSRGLRPVPEGLWAPPANAGTSRQHLPSEALIDMSLAIMFDQMDSLWITVDGRETRPFLPATSDFDFTT